MPKLGRTHKFILKPHPIRHLTLSLYFFRKQNNADKLDRVIKLLLNLHWTSAQPNQNNINFSIHKSENLATQVKL